MLRVTAFANAIASITAAFYVICVILAAVAPDLYLGIARTWVHGMDMTVLYPEGTTTTLGSFVLGLVTLTATGWLAGASLAYVYNRQLSGSRPS